MHFQYQLLGRLVLCSSKIHAISIIHNHAFFFGGGGSGKGTCIQSLHVCLSDRLNISRDRRITPQTLHNFTQVQLYFQTFTTVILMDLKSPKISCYASGHVHTYVADPGSASGATLMHTIFFCYFFFYKFCTVYLSLL